MRYTTLLLDLDHTLLDSDASEKAAFEAALRSVGVVDSQRYFASYQDINKSLWTLVERGEVSPNEVRVTRFERLIQQTEIEADPESLANNYTQGLGAHGELYPGAREMLEELVQKAALALITNGLSDVQRARVERLQLAEYFDAVIISAEIGAAKPGQEIFDKTFQKLGSPAKDNAIILGDSLTSDIRGGTDFGIATCWYNPHRKPSSRDAQVSYEIQQLDQFPPIVFGG